MLPERCKLIDISLTNSIIENQQSKLQMEFYPNPVNNIVQVQLSEQVNNATLKVYTITGQVVLEKTKVSGNKFQLQIENLASGTYFIELTENGNSSRNKLIKN
ncbi:MAG TPA: T9SS type A sorting domain-containing protein [Bacteroidia bacterium]|nr:T9SS type A sorting domain-containing protein [Bacteroidia bacterium]